MENVEAATIGLCVGKGPQLPASEPTVEITVFDAQDDVN